MIRYWNELVFAYPRPSDFDAETGLRCGSQPPPAVNDNSRADPLAARTSRIDRDQLAEAVSLARLFLSTRAQFARTLRGVVEAELVHGEGASRIGLGALEGYVDDALYAIGRDGPERIEDNLRWVMEEMLREAWHGPR